MADKITIDYGITTAIISDDVKNRLDGRGLEYSAEDATQICPLELAGCLVI
jgi:hypothetical protein